MLLYLDRRISQLNSVHFGFNISKWWEAASRAHTSFWIEEGPSFFLFTEEFPCINAHKLRLEIHKPSRVGL
jgi:hypothetical protein